MVVSGCRSLDRFELLSGLSAPKATGLRYSGTRRRVPGWPKLEQCGALALGGNLHYRPVHGLPGPAAAKDGRVTERAPHSEPWEDCDLANYRGAGRSKWLMDTVLLLPEEGIELRRKLQMRDKLSTWTSVLLAVPWC